MNHSIDDLLSQAHNCLTSITGEESVVDAAVEAKRIYEYILSNKEADLKQTASALSGLGDLQSIAEIYQDTKIPSWVFYAIVAVIDPGNAYSVLAMTSELFLHIGTQEHICKTIINILVEYIQNNYVLDSSQQRTLNQIMLGINADNL